MDTLTIETGKSLYKPLSIVIDGQQFRVKTITLDSLERIQNVGDALKAGSAAAIRAMLTETLDGPIEMLGKLSIDEVIKIAEFATKASANGKEKNGSKPEPPK